MRARARGRAPARAAAAALLALALTSGGCRRCADQRPRALRRQTLVVHLESEPPHLVPMIQPDSWAHRIAVHDIIEALVRFDPHPPHELRGELARSWEVSDDGLVYTFELRRGVRWHDGQPFSADDVTFTFARVLDPKVRAVSTRATVGPFIDRVEQLGPHRVRLRCRERSPFFLKSLADVTILPAHLMRRGDLNTHPLLRRPVGTGPYRFVRWADQQIVVERFDGYWGRKPQIRRIVYRLVRSPEIALKLARRGAIDFITRLRAAQWVGVRRDPQIKAKFRQIRQITPGTAFVLLNHRRFPFADQRVRRALAMLLDLETIIDKIMHGLARRIASLYWIGDPECDRGIDPIPFDPAGAARLLREAGFADSDGDGVLERGGRALRMTFLVVASSKSTRRWLTLYQQQLRKAGIALAIKPIEWSAFLARIRGHDFDLAGLGMALAGPYTDLYLQFHSSQIEDGQNYGAYANPRVDALLVEIRHELDDRRRRRLSHELQRLLAADVAAIPLFTLTEPGIVARRVKGVYTTPLWYQLRDWRLEGY